MSVYKFRNCILHSTERYVKKDEKYLALTPKAFNVLLMLVERAGEVVARDELLGKVWNGAIVEESNLTVQISKLRLLLGHRNGERFIETVSGEGYRFIPSVDRHENGNNGSNQIAGPYDHLGRDSEAIRNFLKGKYFREKTTVANTQKAIGYYEKAWAHDPENVYVCSELIESYRFLYGLDSISHEAAMSKTGPLIEVLSCLEQDVDIVHVTYGNVAMFMKWNLDDAEKHFIQALSINPSCGNAQYRYTQLLAFKQSFSQAIKELRRLILIDSYSIRSYLQIGKLFYWMGHFENALIYTSDAIDLEPDYYEALIIHGAVLAELGRYSDALNALQRSLDQLFDVEALGYIGYFYALQSNKDKAHRIIREIEASCPDRNSSLNPISIIHFALGENEDGYKLLEECVEHRGSDLIGLNVDPRWKSVRHEERFKDIIRKIGLPIVGL